MSVIERVVEPGFCSGCGLCAGLCPSEALEMGLNPGKDVVPILRGACSECGLCLDVCPFSGEGPGIDDMTEDLFGDVPGISKNPVSGFHLSLREGYARKGDFRERGASGGMASWFLARTLELGLIDAVLSAGPDESRPGFWTFIKAKTPEDVISQAGSVYHPVPIDGAIRDILLENNHDRYAVVALPCLAYGLRKAMKRIPLLKEKVIVLVSLTCGLMPNHRYSEYVSLESGVLPRNMSYINFRYPPGEPDSSNFRHVAVSREGEHGHPVPVKGAPDLLWRHEVFLQGGCLICDDVFGETADTVFMDAWLPEYEKDIRGNSLVICRTPGVEKMIRDGMADGDCEVREIVYERLMQSQKETLLVKRYLLAGRLARLEETGAGFPERRVAANRKVFQDNRKYFQFCKKLKEAVRLVPLETFEDLKAFQQLVEPFLEEEKRMRFEGESPFESIE